MGILFAELRCGATDVVPWCLRSDKRVHFDLNTRITVDRHTPRPDRPSQQHQLAQLRFGRDGTERAARDLDRLALGSRQRALRRANHHPELALSGNDI